MTPLFSRLFPVRRARIRSCLGAYSRITPRISTPKRFTPPPPPKSQSPYPFWPGWIPETSRIGGDAAAGPLESAAAAKKRPAVNFRIIEGTTCRGPRFIPRDRTDAKRANSLTSLSFVCYGRRAGGGHGSRAAEPAPRRTKRLERPADPHDDARREPVPVRDFPPGNGAVREGRPRHPALLQPGLVADHHRQIYSIEAGTRAIEPIPRFFPEIQAVLGSQHDG